MAMNLSKEIEKNLRRNFKKNQKKTADFGFLRFFGIGRQFLFFSE
jgi:hypothetical protein